MLSINVQKNFARTLVAIAPVHVLGNGSRGDGGNLQSAFDRGMLSAFRAINSEIELRVDFQSLFTEHLENYEDELRAKDNDRTQIDYPAYAVKFANATNHRIPAFILQGWQSDINARCPLSAEECAALLDTDTYKESIEDETQARKFGFKLYMAAALEVR